MKINRLLTIAVAVIALTASAIAQTTRSPYSKMGYGLLNDNATSAQRQMGGVGYASNSGRQINMMNPASYAAIDSMTFLFDMGVDVTYLDSRDDSGRFNDWGGGLDYISMQVPVGSRFGAALGLLPYSSVGYSFGSKISNGSSAYEGTGGINQLALGFSGRIVKGLTVGFNMSYLFGTNYNDVYAVVNSSTQSLFEQVMQVRDYHFQAGAQYSLRIGKRHRATLGVVYTPGKTLLGHTWVQKYDVGSSSPADTVMFTSLRGKFSLPESWGAGISYEWNDRLTVEADFTWQKWGSAKYTEIENFSASKLCDRYRVGFGASYVPNPRGSYMSRVSYRAGGFYNRDYIMVRDNHVRDFGLSCGFGFPTPGAKTMVNVGFEWLNRRATPQALLKENYFNITLGLNFNQVWFFQNKIR